MCASPPSPRHAQPDWMGGGLVSRQMTQAPASDAISVHGETKVAAAGDGPKEATADLTTRQPCDAPTHRLTGCATKADAVAIRAALPH